MPKAGNDLEAALTTSPDDVTALLLAANEAANLQTAAGRKTAEEKLQRVVELDPQNPNGPVGLARLYALGGDRNRAIETLEQGRKRLKVVSLDVDSLLAGLLIDVNRADEAEQVLDEFDRETRRQLPELNSAGRLKLQNVGRVLRARLQVGHGDDQQAVRNLNAVIASTGEGNSAARSVERIQAYALLATIMARQQRLDLAADDWKIVAEQAPALEDAAWKAGVALLRLGRPTEATAQIETYLKLPTASPEAWVSLVQAHLQTQLRLSPNDRNWSEFLNTLQQATTHLPNSAELVFTEAVYAAAVGTDQARDQAVKKLQRLEQRSSQDSTLAAKLVLSYQQLERPQETKLALQRYQEIEPSFAPDIVAGCAAGRRREAQEASQLVLAALPKAASSDRPMLQIAQIKFLLSANKFAEAQQLVAKLIAQSPTNRKLLTLGIEIALAQKDYDASARWENALRECTSKDAYEWRYYRVRRLVGQFASLDSESRAKLGQSIDVLRAERPNWPPLIALAGQFAELRGDRQRAIDAYQMSIELGDNSPETLERLVAALYAEGRYNDANAYLARMATDQPGFARLESVAIAAAVKANRLGPALQMAKKAVDEGSSDPMNYVWLANLQFLNGQQKVAEETYRDAVKRFPSDSRVWNGLFTCLCKPGKRRPLAKRFNHGWNGSRSSTCANILSWPKDTKF